MPSPQTNMTKEMLGRWKQEGDQSMIPGLNFSDSNDYMICTPDRSASWKIPIPCTTIQMRAL